MNSIIMTCKECRNKIDITVNQPANLMCQRCGTCTVLFELPVRLQRIVESQVIDEKTIEKDTAFTTSYKVNSAVSSSVWVIRPIEEKVVQPIQDPIKPVFVPIEDNVEEPKVEPKKFSLKLRPR